MFVNLLSEKARNVKDSSSFTWGDICPVNLFPANLIAVRDLSSDLIDSCSQDLES